MALSDRLALKALASEVFTWPLPAVLARAVSLELVPVPPGSKSGEPRASRVLLVQLGGVPPLPEELDELYAAAMPGVEVQVRWR